MAMTDEQFSEIVERLDRIEAAVEILVGMASPDRSARPDRPEAPATSTVDTADVLKHQVRGWD